jgi:hypothetical protein
MFCTVLNAYVFIFIAILAFDFLSKQPLPVLLFATCGQIGAVYVTGNSAKRNVPKTHQYSL